jgi:two-component system response regulator AlgR
VNQIRDPIRVVIVDDEAPARNRLRQLLLDCAQSIPLTVVAETGGGDSLLALLREKEVDLVFLDIRMPGRSGLETARIVQKMPSPPWIVFTTAYDQHALEAFEVHAVDYLLKPVRARRLLESLELVSQMAASRTGQAATLPPPRTHLPVHERGAISLVPIDEVLFLRSELKYVTARTVSREYLIEESLTRLEEEFRNDFVRIHRGCLVALRHLRGFERSGHEGAELHWVAVLNGLQERLPVSRRQSHVVRRFVRGGP